MDSNFLEIKKEEDQVLLQSLKIAENIDFQSMEAESINKSITDEKSAQQALSMALQSRKLKNQLEDSREEILRPILDYQKDINKIVKDLKSKLEAIEQRLHHKVSDWMKKENQENIFYKREDLEVEDGKIYSKKSWSFEITDENKIPREYLEVDEVAIKDDIKNGMRTIPGVRVFETEEFVIRVKN